MIFVAGRFGFSIWLIICVAASIPSCPELISMEVSWGEVSLANSELLKERNGQIFRYGNPRFHADTLQGKCQDVITDQHGGWTVVTCKQFPKLLKFILGYSRNFDTIFWLYRQSVVQKSCHIACFSVCGKDQRIIDTQICDLPVAQCIEIFGGFLSGQKVIVINIDRVVRVLCRFSDKDIEKSLTEKEKSMTGSFTRE